MTTSPPPSPPVIVAAPLPEDVCVKGGGTWVDTLTPTPKIMTSDGHIWNAPVHNGGCVYVQVGEQLFISLQPPLPFDPTVASTTS